MVRKGTRAEPLLQQTLLGEASSRSDALVFVLTEEGEIVAVNDAAATVTGWSREELLAMPADAIASDLQRAVQLRGEVARKGSSTGSGKLRTRSGDLLPMSFISAATAIGGVQFILVVAVPASR